MQLEIKQTIRIRIRSIKFTIVPFFILFCFNSQFIQSYSSTQLNHKNQSQYLLCIIDYLNG